MYIVYREVFKVSQILHLEPSPDASSLRSDVISSIRILIIGTGMREREIEFFVDNLTVRIYYIIVMIR